MIKKTLFVYNSINLFNILNEIKENFYFELKYIDTKNYKKTNFEQYENYLIISTNFDKNVKEMTPFKKEFKKMIQKERMFSITQTSKIIKHFGVNYHELLCKECDK